MFFDPFDRVPEGGRHQDSCTSPDNPFLSDRNPTFLNAQGLIVEDEDGHTIARQVVCVDVVPGSKNVSYIIFEVDDQKSREKILNNPPAFAAGVDPDFTIFKIVRIIPATPKRCLK